MEFAEPVDVSVDEVVAVLLLRLLAIALLAVFPAPFVPDVEFTAEVAVEFALELEFTLELELADGALGDAWFDIELVPHPATMSAVSETPAMSHLYFRSISDSSQVGVFGCAVRCASTVSWPFFRCALDVIQCLFSIETLTSSDGLQHCGLFCVPISGAFGCSEEALVHVIACAKHTF